MTRLLRLFAAAIACAMVISSISGCGGKPKKKTNPVSAGTSISTDPDKEFSSWDKNASIRAAIENGEYADARAKIMERLDSNPEDARAHFLLGKCYLEEKKLKKAKRCLETAVKRDPENKNFARELGRCLSEISDDFIAKDMPSEAIENLKSAMNYGFQSGQTEDKLANAYQLTAKQLETCGNTTEAENVLREALNLIPDRPSLRIRLAELLIEGDRLMEAERVLKSLSETNPDYEHGLTAYAKLLYRMGEVNLAAEVIGKALSIAPADPEALLVKAQVEKNVAVISPPPPVQEQITPASAKESLVELEKAGKISEQKRILDNLLGQFPDESWAYLKLSETNEKLELHDEALSAIKSYIQANPESDQGKFQLARILQQKGEYEEALNIFNKLAPTYEDKQALLNEMGQVYARMGRFDEARASWNKSLNNDPEHARTLFSLGQLEMETGNTTAAQVFFEKAIRIEPFNAKFRYFTGLNLVQSGLKDQADSFWAASKDYLNEDDPYAKRILRAVGDKVIPPSPADTNIPVVHVPASAIEEAPEEPEYALALEQARAGHFDEAIRGFRTVLQKNPTNFNALMNLGKVYSASGDSARSCTFYLKALKIDPKNIYALRALANSYSEVGLHSFAAGITNQAQTSFPGQLEGFPNYKSSPAAVKNSPRAYQPLARALLDEKLNQEALAVVQSGISEQSESADMLLLQGEVYKELSQFETALESFKKALALEPQNPTPYVKTGDLLVAAGQFSNAIGEYRKALKAGFIDPDTMFVIVDRFQQLGREADATRVLGRLKGMNLNQGQMAKLEAHLEKKMEP